MTTIINDFAEPVPQEEVTAKRGRYLDHFPVLKPGKSTACRVVWNLAAIFDGLALNDGLHKGPDLLNSLFTVLLAWRQNKFAIVGDIRKMFNQVQISAADRIYHRFLWRSGNQDQPPKDYQWKRLPFGDKSAPDLAISALHFLAEKHKDTSPVASSIIREHCYMDDLASSLQSEEDATTAKQEVNSVLASGRFSVKGWHSNSKLVDEFPEEPVADVLGHQWSKGDDTWKIKIPKLTPPEVVTKREVLSCIAKLWDPVGMLAPVTLKLRLLLQDLWTKDLSWDDPVPENTAIRLSSLLSELDLLTDFYIPRCLKPIRCDFLELHGFCDAGEKAYGAVIWLRLSNDSELCELTFVAAKSFVAPKKKKSIPRLELMAMLMLSRLINCVQNVLHANEVFVWTDSTVVLHWLGQPVAKFKPFVSTRVQEITDNLLRVKSTYRYVSSSLNPADALTKAIDYPKLSSWHQGPSFLKKNKTDWPREHAPLPDPKKCSREEKKTKTVHSLHIDTCLNDFNEHLLKRTSSWKKLVRLVAWLRRVLCKRSSKTPNLSSNELAAAKLTLFWISQVSLRSPEQHRLRERLNLEYDDNERALLRIHGRLTNFDDHAYAANPIVLPSDNIIVKLFMTDLHQRLGHQGYRVVIVNLRENGLYVVRARQLVKSITSKCLHCRKKRRRLLEQQMGQLPFVFSVTSHLFLT